MELSYLVKSRGINTRCDGQQPDLPSPPKWDPAPDRGQSSPDAASYRSSYPTLKDPLTATLPTR